MDYEQKYQQTLDKLKAWKEKYIKNYGECHSLNFDDPSEIAEDFLNIASELKEDEDEQMRQKIQRVIESDEFLTFEDRRKLIDWLNNHIQSKSTQTWNLYDFNMISEILVTLRMFQDEQKSKKYIERVLKESEWLKDLVHKASFKLDNQQIYALKTAISILSEERNLPKTAAALNEILKTFSDEQED